jgi:hypothetical protein
VAPRIKNKINEIKSHNDDSSIYRELELGLGSALALFQECEIVLPANHPDPGAVIDCKKNVWDAYDLLNRYGYVIDAAQELLEACQMMLWSEENGGAEAQRQGKPRYSERVEILRNAIAKATGEKEEVK